MKHALRFLDTGARTGAQNMALDEALVHTVQAGGKPVLRLYSWAPPAVSLGYAQDAEGELDLIACRTAGVNVVRRPTGGRAVLHWDELTYSAVFPIEDVPFAARIEDLYETVGACLVAGIRRLGIDVELERGQARPPRARSGTAALPCFSSIARSEVKWQGRKLVGSAQRRFRGAVLQHGSILLGSAHERLVDWLRIEPEQKDMWRQRLRADSTCLRECIDRPIDRTELIESLVAGFSEVMHCELVRDEIEPREWAHCLERSNFWNAEARPVEAAH